MKFRKNLGHLSKLKNNHLSEVLMISLIQFKLGLDKGGIVFF